MLTVLHVKIKNTDGQAWLAQLEEQMFSNHQVGGSGPSPGARAIVQTERINGYCYINALKRTLSNLRTMSRVTTESG